MDCVSVNEEAERFGSYTWVEAQESAECQRGQRKETLREEKSSSSHTKLWEMSHVAVVAKCKESLLQRKPQRSHQVFLNLKKRTRRFLWWYF